MTRSIESARQTPSGSVKVRRRAARSGSAGSRRSRAEWTSRSRRNVTSSAAARQLPGPTAGGILPVYARLRDPPPLPRLLRAPAARDPPELLARAGGRSDAAVHERRDGPVQEGLPRHGGAARTGSVARRRRRSACAPAASTTTSSRWATRPGTTRSSRCSATSRSATTSSATRSASPGSSSPSELAIDPRAPARHRAPRGRRGVGALAGDRRPAGVAHLPPGRQGQLLADGGHGPVRPVHRDLRRPRARRADWRFPGGRDRRVDRARRATSSRTTRSSRARRRGGSSRSGTSCSCSSTGSRTARSCRCRSRRWTRARGSSASRRCCRA